MRQVAGALNRQQDINNKFWLYQGHYTHKHVCTY